MADIYEMHEKAFAKVSAFVILKGGERVATVAIKFPADGAGRLWAYVHLIGLEMVRGHAGGYGYDKRSAAVSAAIQRIPFADNNHDALTRGAFQGAAAAMDSDDWTRALEKAGFTVLQAV
jgi:hypothetical protein